MFVGLMKHSHRSSKQHKDLSSKLPECAQQEISRAAEPTVVQFEFTKSSAPHHDTELVPVEADTLTLLLQFANMAGVLCSIWTGMCKEGEVQ